MIKKTTINIILAFLCFPLSSCLEGVSTIEDLEAPEDKPATLTQIQKTLIDAWGYSDPLTMKKDDFLYQETTQIIENNTNPIFVLQEGITVSSKTEMTEEWIYKYLYQNRTFKNGVQGPESTREDVRKVAKETSDFMAIAPLKHRTLESFADDYQMTLGFERFLGLVYSCQMSSSLQNYCQQEMGYDSCSLKCVNLTTTSRTESAPEMIKNQTDCGGLPDCQIKINRVSFDWIISLKKGPNTEKQRVNYSIELSPDLPFLSRMTGYCFRQLYPVQNQKILVNTCTSLKNYKSGPVPESSALPL